MQASWRSVNRSFTTMTALITLSLLSLLALSQAADQTCEDLVKPRVLEDDYSSIMGRWTFSDGIASHPLFTTILLTVNSSWVKFAPSSLRDTVILSQGNMLNGKCEFQTTNATIENSKLSVTEQNVTTEGNFLSSCSGCLTLNFTSQTQNETINSLYLFTKGPRASESEMELYWKQAKCLGFKKEPQFSYDGVTEFCQVDKRDSSKQPSEHELKKDE